MQLKDLGSSGRVVSLSLFNLKLEEISQRTYMPICIAQGHRQQCGEVGGRRLGGRGQSGGMEDICNSVNNFCKVLCTTVTRET